jgi:hypothetical protein
MQLIPWTERPTGALVGAGSRKLYIFPFNIWASFSVFGPGFTQNVRPWLSTFWDSCWLPHWGKRISIAAVKKLP